MAAAKANVYEMVTTRIIEELEKGIIPWEKPWTGIRAGAYNRVSKKAYSMINQMLLKHTGEYATFKQWQDLGGHVKKGEKSEIVVFWKILEKEEMNEDTGEKEVKKIPMLRYYNVFHITQVEGVKPLERPFAEVEPIAEGDKIILDYITREHIKFDECASNEAYYSPSSDRVVVPMKEQYKAINEYYSTTFHELTHSTGHKNRLNRLQTGAVAAFGGEEYSKEELVAEIGSASLMNMLGIETTKTFRNSAAYIQSWVKVLKNDNKFIVSAEDMPKNSESQMLSQTIRWIKKNCPEVKVLFTWADGMVGKPGYVYQGSNFYYLGYIWTDMYMKNGIKLHPRQTKQFFAEDKEDKRLTCRPTFEQQQEVGIQHYRGKQFKYLFFTCGKREKKRLMKECTEPLSRDYPKDVDLEWKMQVGKGKWELCSRPPYSTDMNSEIDSGIGLEKAAEKDTAAKDDITGNAA